MKVRRVDRIGVLAVQGKQTNKPAALGDDVVAASITSEGFLRARARIARDGLLEYSDGKARWNELRTVDELRAAANSFALVLVTDDHPEDFVTADNARELGTGFLGQDLAVEQAPDGRSYLVATITITDAATIAKVKAGKQELSIGFVCRVTDEVGTFEGTEFRGRQTDLEGNHTAIVDEGRAGPLAKIPVGDQIAANRKIRDAMRGAVLATRRIDQRHRSDSTMEPVAIEIPAGTFEVDPAIAEYIATLQAQLQAAAPPAAEAATGAAPAAAPPAPAAAPAVPGLVIAPAPARVGDAQLRAERDAAVARADAAEASARKTIDARVQLLTDAREFIGVEAGTADHEVHRAVAIAAFPTMATELAALKGDTAEDRGYLRAMHVQGLAELRRARGDIRGHLDSARQAHVADAGDDLSDIHKSADDLASRRAGKTSAK